MEMNLIDAVVHTRTGEGGRVKLVAMEPEARKVTHLVVHKGLLLGRDVVVPIEHVARLEPGHVYLDVSSDELQGYPDFEERLFVSPSEGWEYPVAFPLGGVVWPLATGWMTTNPYPLLASTGIKENIPPEDVTIETGTPVECTDGHCGHIERVVMDEDSHEVTAFVIRRGFFFARDVLAPVSWIDHLERDHVFLKLTKRQVSEMAEYFDDKPGR
ncbi:MAG: hypothetical protein JWM80_5127 [Cyanobacteria bacterium RYN_339]|nr:hypothetical protein [Cyanobacteria bacterium RYN_339]